MLVHGFLSVCDCLFVGLHEGPLGCPVPDLAGTKCSLYAFQIFTGRLSDPNLRCTFFISLAFVVSIGDIYSPDGLHTCLFEELIAPGYPLTGVTVHKLVPGKTCPCDAV